MVLSMSIHKAVGKIVRKECGYWDWPLRWFVRGRVDRASRHAHKRAHQFRLSNAGTDRSLQRATKSPARL